MQESAVGGQGQRRGKGKLRMHTPPAAPSFCRASWRRDIEDEQHQSLFSNRQLFRNGSNTRPIFHLPLRLSPHCARTALPSIYTTYHQTTTSPPAPPSISNTSNTGPRGTPPNPLTTLRPLGWNPQRRAQEENFTYEEATPTNGGREAFEGCHGVE